MGFCSTGTCSAEALDETTTRRTRLSNLAAHHWTIDTDVGTVLVSVESLRGDGRVSFLVGYAPERLPETTVHPRAPPKTPAALTSDFNDPETDGITFEMRVWRDGDVSTYRVVRSRNHRIEASRGRRANYRPRLIDESD